MLHVYLSPHLDDVVLSCGGRLWVTQGEGRDQRVITIKAGVPRLPALSPFAAQLHADWGNLPRPVELRRAEDLAALARLGVLDVVHLDGLDAIYRLGPDGEALYDSFATLVGALHSHEAGLPANLTKATVIHLPPPNQCVVYSPMAIGGHVDHRVTYAISVKLRRRGYQVLGRSDGLLPVAAAHAVRRQQRVGHPRDDLQLRRHACPARGPLRRAHLASGPLRSGCRKLSG
jgi:LmbE family N-acetylglucosaminyl deacetylase